MNMRTDDCDIMGQDLQKISFLDNVAEGKSDANSGSPDILEEWETQKKKKKRIIGLQERYQKLLQPIETYECTLSHFLVGKTSLMFTNYTPPQQNGTCSH